MDYNVYTAAQALLSAIECEDPAHVSYETEQLVVALGGGTYVIHQTPELVPLYIAALLARRVSE